MEYKIVYSLVWQIKPTLMIQIIIVLTRKSQAYTQLVECMHKPKYEHKKWMSLW
jgi:hypothetical protein